jgi:carbamoylphosphate synthase large subunit
VVTEFIEDAKEIEIDAVADKGEIIAYALSEHIEFAGVHSGDATMVLPPQKLYFETIRRIKKISKAIAEELQISGPFQHAVPGKRQPDQGDRMQPAGIKKLPLCFKSSQGQLY